MELQFGGFALSQATRTLSHEGRAIPLIPRYLDLLILLVERRHEAVSRRTIMDVVWADVVVSEGALSQAIRTLRRCLGDDPREPRFIRTVSRHGYQFVCPVEVAEGRAIEPARRGTLPRSPSADDAFERELDVLLGSAINGSDGDPRIEAAERLHLLGTEEALQRLGTRPGHERGRALLREARWGVPGAGPVALWGQPAALKAVAYLCWLRVHRALRALQARWMGAVAGGGLAGAIGGGLGGCVLVLGPGATASAGAPVVLALLGAAVGGAGAAGVGAGLVVAEAVFRSARSVMLIPLGALGGGLVGLLAHSLALAMLEALFGATPSPLGGGIEGLALGGGAAVGYALSTHPREGGMATPRGWRRWGVAVATGAGCGAAGIALGASGYHMGAMSLELLSRSFPGSHVGLAPLARLVGEVAPGPWTSVAISASEGLLFGLGLALGLTRRPRS